MKFAIRALDYPQRNTLRVLLFLLTLCVALIVLDAQITALATVRGIWAYWDMRKTICKKISQDTSTSTISITALCFLIMHVQLTCYTTTNNNIHIFYFYQ